MKGITSSFWVGVVFVTSISIGVSDSSVDAGLGSEDSRAEGLPLSGEASRDDVMPGSLFAVKAAFKRFSASSPARRSCSCMASAVVCNAR